MSAQLVRRHPWRQVSSQFETASAIFRSGQLMVTTGEAIKVADDQTPAQITKELEAKLKAL